MVTLYSYLTKPDIPKDLPEFQVRIYKHLFQIAVIEGLLYISVLLFIIFKN
jgi:hypothetical protein